MNCHIGYKLDVTPIKQLTTNNTDDCILECIDTINCVSLNVEHIDHTSVDCSLLSTDRHWNNESFQIATGMEHCAIMVK